MEVNKAIRVNSIFVTSLITLSFIMKALLASYGNPFLFHPDEPYIYKDSFKFLYAITEGDFSLVTNPYNLLLSLWYSLCYPLGKLIGMWASYADFKNQILAESFNIIYCGRLFSLLISCCASMYLFKFFSKNKTNAGKLLIALIIFFNPIEWVSDIWIKFDPICYLLNVLILVKLVSYKEGKTSLTTVAVLLGLAFAVRMDFASYIIGFILLVFFKFLPKLGFKKTIMFFVICGVTFLVSTNTLFHLVIGSFTKQVANVQLDEGFVAVFLNKMHSMSLSAMIKNIGLNGYYYLLIALIIHLPILLYDMLFLRFKAIKSKEFWLLQLFLLFVLLIFNFAAPHYIFVTQICYLFFIFKNFVEPVGKSAKVFVVIGVFYFISLSFELFYYVRFKQDTRISAMEFVYSNSKPSDIIAVEGYQNIGFVPPVNECDDQLRFKAEYVRKNKMGTGFTYEAKADRHNANCRRVLELETENRFGKDSIADLFVNVYDVKKLEKLKPSIVIYKNEWKMENHPISASFYKYIKKQSINKMIFEPLLIDPRMKFFQKECFNPGFTIYSMAYN